MRLQNLIFNTFFSKLRFFQPNEVFKRQRFVFKWRFLTDRILAIFLDNVYLSSNLAFFLFKNNTSDKILERKNWVPLDEKPNKPFDFIRRIKHSKNLFFFKKKAQRKPCYSHKQKILLLFEGLVCLVRNKKSKPCFTFHSFLTTTTRT